MDFKDKLNKEIDNDVENIIGLTSSALSGNAEIYGSIDGTNFTFSTKGDLSTQLLIITEILDDMITKVNSDDDMELFENEAANPKTKEEMSDSFTARVLTLRMLMDIIENIYIGTRSLNLTLDKVRNTESDYTMVLANLMKEKERDN